VKARRVAGVVPVIVAVGLGVVEVRERAVGATRGVLVEEKTGAAAGQFAADVVAARGSWASEKKQ
jgi:hypothetical protein